MTSSRSSMPEPPPMLAVDANGFVWRVYDEYWSMAPSNPDNEPVPEPITYYVPLAGQERRRELEEQRQARKHVSRGSRLGFTYRPTPPSGPPPEDD